MSSLLVGLGLCFVKAPASDCTTGNLTLNFPIPLEDYRDELFAGGAWLVEAGQASPLKFHNSFGRPRG